MIKVLYVIKIAAVLVLDKPLAMWQVENAKRLSNYLIDHVVVAAVLTSTIQ